MLAHRMLSSITRKHNEGENMGNAEEFTHSGKLYMAALFK